MLRALTVLAAAVACAWFVLGARQARDVDHATAVLSVASHVDAGTARRVSSLLDAASFLNPDRQVAMLRGQLADARGDRHAGERILRRVTEAEPLNAEAWVLLARSATTGATLRLAFAHLEKLVPTVRAARSG